jgi:tRNA threonylcarbamoyladenosine biosynthesis protein TsaE
MTHVIRTEQETKKLAGEFAQKLRGGEVVFLNGDLGSGKTTFVRGVAQSLGFHEPVRSPSFTLVNRYKVSSGGINEIVHVDLYRLKTPDELRALALDEEIGRNDAIVFVEWPQNAQGLLGESTYSIDFVINGDSRAITIRQQSLTPHQPM